MRRERIVLEETEYGVDLVDRSRLKKQMNIRPKGDRKWWSLHLGAFWRYLDKHIGKKWDDVYSYICQRFSKQDEVASAIYDYIDNVIIHPEMRDGVPYDLVRGEPLSRYSSLYIGNTFFVDYEDGILKKVPKKKSERKRKPECPFRKQITEHTLYAKHPDTGCWFFVEIVPVPKGWTSFFDNPHPKRLLEPNTEREYSVKSCRSASKKEKKKHCLS